MLARFPPGDLTCSNLKPHNAWRDFKFALNQVSRSIEPTVSLEYMLANCNRISESLAENPRQRNSQLVEYFYY